MSQPLSGSEQSAQRAEVRAILAALQIENRPLHIFSDSSYAVDQMQNLLNGMLLPVDGEHIDLWKRIQILVSLRYHPLKISWTKGHISQDLVDAGLFLQFQKDGNDAADRAAVKGAAQHAIPDSVVKKYFNNSKHMAQVALMYVQIACARNQRANQLKVLTYSKNTSQKGTLTNVDNMPIYQFHEPKNQACFPKLKKPPVFSGKLRFRFGQLAWEAVMWYVSQLRWPKKDETLGVTWIELALDFEISTGLVLPRCASICEKSYGSRLLGRGAEWRFLLL